MVIHEENDLPEEVIITKPSNSEPETSDAMSYLQEVNNYGDINKDVNIRDSISSEINTERVHCKALKKNKKIAKNTTVVSETVDCNTSAVELIDKADLEELKSIYKKCKAVVRKIETKYGHLLDLEEHSYQTGRKRVLSETEEECHCTINKKIVFDDDGKQSLVEPVPENHICSKKIKNAYSPSPPPNSIQIEYSEDNLELPDNLEELWTILRNSHIEISYRNKVIEKLKSVRLEHANEIKFNKHTIIDKLKSNPDEVLNFQGTNLSTVNGYL